MAAAAAAREAQRTDGKLKSVPVAASTKVYKGTLVAINSSGYAVPAADTANFKLAGVAYETVDNSSGANGDKSVRVEKSGEFEMNGSGLAQGDLGKEVYVTDDNTVQTAANTNGMKVGAIAEVVSASKARVRIDNYVR
jgi:hypothetical protein